MENAIILCSGGLDSVVTVYYVRHKLKYKKIIILFFDYNQRTIKEERKAAKKCAKEIGADFIEIKLKELGKISTSLINKKIKVKKIKRKELKDTKKESEKFYVPMRNSVFLIHAIALAESLKIKEKEDLSKKAKLLFSSSSANPNKAEGFADFDIFVGFKCEGKEAYPDTTIEFVDAINKLIKFSNNKNGKIIAPLIKKDKEDIILLGKKLGVDFKKTYSCYAGSKNGKHCGTCLSCRLRQEGFYWAGVKDATIYENK